MKLRYVFPLMLVVATVSGAAGLSLNDFRRTIADSVERRRLIYDAEVQKRVYEREHRSLAKSMAFLCPVPSVPSPPSDLQAVITDFTVQIAREWQEETKRLSENLDVRRVGPSLRIRVGNESVEFLDVGYLCHNVDVQIHRYRGKLLKNSLHVVGVRFYEGADDSILIWTFTRQQFRTFENLLESPSQTRLVAYAAEEGEGNRGIEIFLIDGLTIDSELRSSSSVGARHPVFGNDYLLEVIGWIDDESMLLLMSQNRQAKLFRRDGKWQLEYLSR